MHKIAIYIVLSLLCLSCASSSGTGTSGSTRKQNVITSEEIAESMAKTPMRNAHDIIKYLRPSFLRVRGTTSARSTGSTLPVVYLDNIRFGALSNLQNIMAEQVAEIRYLSPSDATFRFGGNHTGGAILIKSK